MSTTTINPNAELAELGKFFEVAARRFAAGEAAPEMFSTAIDAAWHNLAADSEAHRKFSLEHADRELVHVESAGHGVITWVSAYEEAYGPLPELWFTDASGVTDTRALAVYRETGTVVASWSCGPADGDVVPEKTER
ncbi:hypothetical protein ACIRPK_04530 [Kitasatospora sp. NPDC101801]|uniref:hypothetical protein n=1 Tax=Kitasatospora sp. NPDC101801 TaxID=3364103 RepID=UPI0037F3BE4D